MNNNKEERTGIKQRVIFEGDEQMLAGWSELKLRAYERNYRCGRCLGKNMSPLLDVTFLHLLRDQTFGLPMSLGLVGKGLGL